MKAVLFVGQGPNKENGKPFVGRSGKRLATLLGTKYEAMFAEHAFVNIVDQWQGKNGKGDRFDVSGVACQAKVASEMTTCVSVVFCGKAVAMACGIKSGYLDRFVFSGKPAMILPHPSGINRWWNDESKATAAQKRLRAFVTSTRKQS